MKSKYKEKKNPNVQKAGNASFGSLRAGGGAMVPTCVVRTTRFTQVVKVT